MDQLTLSEAVAQLQTDGPSVTEQIKKMTADTVDAQTQVHVFETALQQLRQGLEEKLSALVPAAQALRESLDKEQKALDVEMQETDHVVLALQNCLHHTQDELGQQMHVAQSQMDALKVELDKLPPALREEINHQSEIFNQSISQIDHAKQTLTKTVGLTVQQMDHLKQAVEQNQKLVGTHVDSLTQEVHRVHGQARSNTDILVATSTKIVDRFERHLNEIFTSVAKQPGEDVKAGIEDFKRYADGELKKLIDHLIHEGLNKLLQGLERAADKNAGIISQLRLLVPDKLVQGGRDLSYVVMHLDQLMKRLAHSWIDQITNWLSGGLDFIAEKTGINLDVIKNGIKALGSVVKIGVDIGAGQIAMARDLITNPGNLANDAITMMEDVRSGAASLGKLAGIGR